MHFGKSTAPIDAQFEAIQIKAHSIIYISKFHFFSVFQLDQIIQVIYGFCLIFPSQKKSITFQQHISHAILHLQNNCMISDQMFTICLKFMPCAVEVIDLILCTHIITSFSFRNPCTTWIHTGF